jgi:molybdopterin-guanine dinucleotide biosynthesis protein A
MGTDKSAVEIDGKSLLAIAADKLRRIFPEVIIAGVSKDSPEIDLPVYADVFEGYGPVGGLYTALLNTARPHIFLLPVDMPHVSEELIRRICSLSESGKANIPVCGDLAQPLCAIYPESMKLRAE